MNTQNGFSLIMVMFVLTILITVSLALMQSTETANKVAGNIAFKQASTAATDVGINEALTQIQNRTALETTVDGEYYATSLPTDANGLPTTVDWAQVPVTQIQNYRVQHITERLCTGTLPIQNPTSQCIIGQISAPSSNKVNSPVYGSQNSYFYRVTIQANGPNNTNSFIQTILKK